MFAIRSKKTNKTFLRFHAVGRYDWVMFREEEPFISDDLTVLLIHTQEIGLTNNVDFDIVPISDVPTINSHKSIDEILSEKPEPWAVEINRLEEENKRLQKLLADIVKIASNS